MRAPWDHSFLLLHAPNCTLQLVSQGDRGGLAKGKETGQAVVQHGGREGRLTWGPGGNKGFMILVDGCCLYWAPLSALAETNWEEPHCSVTTTVTYLQTSSSQCVGCEVCAGVRCKMGGTLPPADSHSKCKRDPECASKGVKRSQERPHTVAVDPHQRKTREQMSHKQLLSMSQTTGEGRRSLGNTVG